MRCFGKQPGKATLVPVWLESRPELDASRLTSRKLPIGLGAVTLIFVGRVGRASEIDWRCWGCRLNEDRQLGLPMELSSKSLYRCWLLA